MRSARAAAIALAVTALGSCSFSGLTGYEVAECDPMIASLADDACDRLNTESGCTPWQCDSATHRCVQRPRDFDRDGEPDRECGGADCDDVNATVLPGRPETCDGRDNNCDGRIDEGCMCNPGQSEDCWERPNGESIPDVEPCKAGKHRCSDLGKWEPCLGAVGTQIEICDGVDNNCNGTVDDRCKCKPTDPAETCWEDSQGNKVPQQGECHPGKRACQGDGNWGPCYGAFLSAKETCDGKDNDCDGEIDNGCDCKPGDTLTCWQDPQGNGIPKRGTCSAGTKTCDGSGQWGACLGAVGPQAELCDGKDNDCDGANDNGVVWMGLGVGATCTIGKGACRRSGRVVCNGPGSAICNATVVAPVNTPRISAEPTTSSWDWNCDGSVTQQCCDANGALCQSCGRSGTGSECSNPSGTCLNACTTSFSLMCSLPSRSISCGSCGGADILIDGCYLDNTTKPQKCRGQGCRAGRIGCM